MQAVRQSRSTVRQRHAAAAVRETKRFVLQLVLAVVLGFTFIWLVFLPGEDIVYIEPVNTPVVAESYDSIDSLAHSLRAESRINKIEAALN